MITIQAGMLAALGFLSAILLALLMAPAFWSRAVRLTTKRLKETMPLSEREIEADRDRIRAEYAIKMHKLETLVDQVKTAAIRQQIEINRRDAHVNMLEANLEEVKANYEEAQNARRVLEQTITDRLPEVETRLSDARRQLRTRDQEIEKLADSTQRQKRALDDAETLNSQNQSEIDRLRTSLSARGRNGSGAAAQVEASLRSEVESLRAKTKEQAQLLARMQSLSGRASIRATKAEGEGMPALDAGAAGAREHGELESEIRTLKAQTEDQSGEIARLKAALAVFDDESGQGKGAVRESRLALRARAQSLEAQNTRQAETVHKLRGELAAANE
ncbi:MAG: hypothetical protein ACK5JT_21570, partial [Hyphomicrobiaceae bacterium]